MGKKDDSAGFPLGSRTERPHSKSGWTHKRDEDATAPLETPPPDGKDGFSATGRKK